MAPAKSAIPPQAARLLARPAAKARRPAHEDTRRPASPVATLRPIFLTFAKELPYSNGAGLAN